MNVSTDLVNWTYVGDAFPLDGGDLPDWIGPAAAFWAPEVVYSEATDKYYLFVTVTDTTAAGGGSADPNCTSDSAIGVAYGDSPTGPWTFADEPVVAPRSNGPGCNYFWTYDPDVLGDTVTDEGILYYGSYYGGIFATDVTFTETEVTPDDVADVQIAIANRYEGANVVYKDGYYYLFVSATNCCNGALTGYSVFVGRSTSPYGPFLDQQGNSFMEANVGGTPFLTMNGNRWIGTGHNSVFVDEGGQWWTVYHAVDQGDPFYDFAEGDEDTLGFTKRPALLDPVDWVNGWPVVNGGYMASDDKMPAPAAQEGERTRYRPKLVKPDTVNRLIDRDEFTGSTLDGDWSWADPAEQGEVTVEDGLLRWEVEHTDLYTNEIAGVDTDSASVLVRDAPSGDYVVETKVRLEGLPDDGCCFNYAQAGLVIYADDDNYVKLTSASIWETRQTEFAKETSDVPAGWSNYGNTVVGPPGDDDDLFAGDWTYLRIVVERLTGAEQEAAGGDTERYTAYTSQDGVTWVRGGTWTHSLGDDALIGLVSMGATDQVTSPITAEFDYVRVYSLKGTARPRP
jgi:arabinan endo-1,5-alpha-L-arabinosidase